MQSKNIMSKIILKIIRKKTNFLKLNTDKFVNVRFFMKKISILLLVLTLASCSFNDSKNDGEVAQGDDLEFSVDSLADVPGTELQVEEEKVSEVVAIPDSFKEPEATPELAQQEVPAIDMEKPEEPRFNDFKKEEIGSLASVEKTIEAPARIEMKEPAKIIADYNSIDTSKIEKYKVQRGDTLMMVAFKIYGDYGKWRDIKRLNPNVKFLSAGVELKYNVPSQKFGWEPVGDPYLVKTGDTLGLISKDKYGTMNKWRLIYENNRPLIKNPNLIFAGFTLYYRPLRDLASQPK